MTDKETSARIYILSVVALIPGIVIMVVFSRQAYFCALWLRTHNVAGFVGTPSDSEIKAALIRCTLLALAGFIVAVTQAIIIFSIGRKRPIDSQ